MAARTGSGPAIVRVPAASLEAIEDAARAARPREACGLLVGRRHANGAEITRAIVSENVAPETRDRFEVDPKIHLSLQRELRGSSEAVIGHFHSHPNGRETPSPADLASPGDAAMIWLITALAHDRVIGTRAFTLAPAAATYTEWRLALEEDGKESGTRT